MRRAVYVRVSTQYQAQAQTIEQQSERLRLHFQQRGWEWEETTIFRDDGYSGATLRRPGLDSLRERVRAGELDLVVLTAPDRLARKYAHQVLLLEEMVQGGCQVDFLERPIGNSPHDELVVQILGSVAEFERTLIAGRMRQGRLCKLREGNLLPWVEAPYGLRVDPEKPRDPRGVSIEESEAAVVREMAATFLEEGGTFHRVARSLQEAQILTPTGKRHWYPSVVRGILTNPAYMGKVYGGRSRARPARYRRSPLQPVAEHSECHEMSPPEEWFEATTIPAILSEEEFMRIQEKLAHNKQMASRNNKSHEYLLRALVSCGQCRKACTGRATGKYRYYVCCRHGHRLPTPEDAPCPARSIPVQQLDALVWEDVCRVLAHPQSITYALERAHGGHWLPQELQARREGLDKAQTSIERQIERLTTAYAEGVIGLEELSRRRKELQQRREGLEQQMKQLAAQTRHREELAVAAASIEEFCQRVGQGLAGASFEQKRQLVELLIDRVVVTEGEVEIRYVIPTTPDSGNVRFCHLRTDYFSR